MPANHVCPEIHQIVAGSPAKTETVSVSFLGKLEAGELLTGTPTVLEETTADLQLSSKVVNTTVLVINGVSHIAGQAITFSVNPINAVVGRRYNINLYCATNSTPARNPPAKVRIDAVEL